MRLKHYIVIGALLALMLLLWSFMRGRLAPAHEMLAQEQGAPAEGTAGSRQGAEPPQELPSSPPPDKGLASPPDRPAQQQDETNRQQAVLAEWQAPIEFYGRVLDQDTNPIPDANVRFSWTDLTNEDASTSTTASDAAGSFSLQGKHGRSLTVWVSKDGYYAAQGGQKTFLYALTSQKFSAEPASPVIFFLKKKGQLEALHVLNKSYRIPRDGTSVGIDLETGEAVTGTGGDFTVRCWTADAGRRPGERYGWRCQVSVPDGGLILTDKELDFVAPENGYRASAEITMPADRPNWKDDVDLKFFYRLRDGRYGRMTFSMIAGGDHFCLIESFLNPSGSRNLELDPRRAVQSGRQ